MVADQVMELGDAFHAFRETAATEPFAFHVLHEHIVVGLGPIHPDKDHLGPPRLTGVDTSPRTQQLPND